MKIISEKKEEKTKKWIEELEFSQQRNLKQKNFVEFVSEKYKK